MQSNEIIHAHNSATLLQCYQHNRHQLWSSKNLHKKHKVHFKWSKNATFHYITLKTIYSGLSKSNFKYHYGDAAIEQCLGMTAEINVFSFWRNVVSNGADWTSAGRLFHSRRPAAARERSSTVTRRDGWTSRRLDVDKHSWPRGLIGRLTTYFSRSDKYWGAVPWRAR